MKIAVHYCHIGFANCYMLALDGGRGAESAGEALIIDPGYMDENILDFIENNRYTLKGILLTHDHENHTKGLRTLMRIYDVEIFAAQLKVADFHAALVRDGDVLKIGGFTVEVISVPGHSADSVVYKIKNFLFTGDALSAGMMGATSSPYGAMRQIEAIQNKLFSLSGKIFVFPGHGPPSLLECEKKFNIEMSRYMENKMKSERRWYNTELL